jgi:hypothetical protein
VIRNLFVVYFIICLWPTELVAQKRTFQGYIHYVYTFTDKLGNDITEQKRIEHGAELHYYINERNYKSYNEKGELTQFYNALDNIHYARSKNKLESVDASVRFPEQFELKFLPDTEVILGKTCKAAQVTNELYESVYYFTDDLRLDYNAFLNHNFGSWNKLLQSLDGALTVKYITRFVDYDWIVTAVEVKPMKLKDQDFDLNRELGIKK